MAIQKTDMTVAVITIDEAEYRRLLDDVKQIKKETAIIARQVQLSLLFTAICIVFIGALLITLLES